MKRLLILSLLTAFALSQANPEKAEKAKWKYIEEKLVEAPKANASTIWMKTGKALPSTIVAAICAFFTGKFLDDAFPVIRYNKSGQQVKIKYDFKGCDVRDPLIFASSLLAGSFGFTIIYKILGSLISNGCQNTSLLNFINQFWPDKKEQTPQDLHHILDDAKKLGDNLKSELPAVKALVYKNIAERKQRKN